GQGEKSRFARQRHWRGPIGRKPDKARSVQIERKRGVAIGAVQMQTKECDAQQALEQKLATWILSLVQDFVGAEETRQRSEVRLDAGFQIAQHVMFAVTLAVDLIVRIARI